jgi:hypothetical protein
MTLATAQHPMRRLHTRTVTFVYRRAYFLVRSLDAPFDAGGAASATCSVLSPDDLRAYAAFRPQQGEDVARRRFARGDHCLVVWHEGAIVHAGWAATRRVYIPYLESDMLVIPGDIYSYDSYTLPAFRGKGLAVAKSILLQTHFRSLGYRRTTAIVAVENSAGLALTRAAAYRPLGRYMCVRLGVSRLCWGRAWGADPLPELVVPAGD